MHAWMTDWMIKWMNDEWWMNEWMHACMNEWMNEWMNACMNEWVNECMHAFMTKLMKEWKTQIIRKDKMSHFRIKRAVEIKARLTSIFVLEPCKIVWPCPVNADIKL